VLSYNWGINIQVFIWFWIYTYRYMNEYICVHDIYKYICIYINLGAFISIGNHQTGLYMDMYMDIYMDIYMYDTYLCVWYMYIYLYIYVNLGAFINLGNKQTVFSYNWGINIQVRFINRSETLRGIFIPFPVYPLTP
jgi:hypothetical protein